MSVVLNPYLSFVDNAAEALEFYKSVFGGEVTISHFGDFPGMPADDETKKLVMHSVLKTDDLQLMISDSKPMGGVKQNGENVQLSLSGDDDAKLTKFFEGLSAGGVVRDELSVKPWGDKFGMLTDKFGIHWLVNIGKPQA